MNCNLGQCSLRRKRRGGDPMVAFDGLPQPVLQCPMGCPSGTGLVSYVRATYLVQVAR